MNTPAIDIPDFLRCPECVGRTYVVAASLQDGNEAEQECCPKCEGTGYQKPQWKVVPSATFLGRMTRAPYDIDLWWLDVVTSSGIRIVANYGSGGYFLTPMSFNQDSAWRWGTAKEALRRATAIGMTAQTTANCLATAKAVIVDLKDLLRRCSQKIDCMVSSDPDVPTADLLNEIDIALGIAR